jgi:hypothetical protein
MTLKDDFQKLKLAIVGTKTTDIDAKLDKAVADITNYKSQSGRNGYIDLVRTLIGQTSTGFNVDPNKGIFSHGANPATFGQSARIKRYRTYEGIIATINYCYRALEVLTDNIIAPDDITKISLEVKAKKFLEDETPTESKTMHVKGVIKKLRIEEMLHYIVKNTLLFGDFFSEIADAKTALTSRALLTEAQTYIVEHESDIQTGRVEVLTASDYTINMDYTAFLEKTLPDKSTKGKNIEAADKLSLVFHEPTKVVKLQSEMYPLCFGYLIFPKTANVPQLSLQDQAVNDICSTILKSLSKKLPQMKEFDSKELRDIIASMLEQGHDHNKMMSIRYVPPDKMQHFTRPSTKYYPYGESIFDASTFTARCLVAMETALTIHRLNRSMEKRKIAVEIGLPRDARNLVEKLKEEFRKRKISIDSLGTVDTIPSMISTFEDIYIPQKDGKAFVDVSTFNEGSTDIRGKVDELKFMRDSVVASLGVPPSFLAIEENLSNKAALSEENILFARTIISHQKYLTHQLEQLVQKVYDIINPEEALTLLDNVSIALPPPKSLQYEREARYLNEVANLIETLDRIGVPKAYTMKKYLTNIDWTDLKNYEDGETVEKELGTKKDDELAGMGGGMGGGSGGMGF